MILSSHAKICRSSYHLISVIGATGSEVENLWNIFNMDVSSWQRFQLVISIHVHLIISIMSLPLPDMLYYIEKKVSWLSIDNPEARMVHDHAHSKLVKLVLHKGQPQTFR